jgi:hypothetical protein
MRSIQYHLLQEQGRLAPGANSGGRPGRDHITELAEGAAMITID